MAMARHGHSFLLVGTTLVSLLLLLGPSTASVVTKTLLQTPVTGRLADGGTFHGRLTLQALRLDEAGHLVATGVLSGTATPAVGRATKVPARTFTTPPPLLVLRAPGRTLAGDRAPRRDRRPVGDGNPRRGPRHQGARAHVYGPRRVAGSAGHLQDPRRGSGAAHRGTARAGTHAGARAPGS